MNDPLEPLQANFEKTESPIPMRVNLTPQACDLNREPLLGAKQHSYRNDQIESGNGLGISQSGLFKFERSRLAVQEQLLSAPAVIPP